MKDFHKSVLLQTAIDFLKVTPGDKYIDCTLGDGGHSLEILNLGGEVLGLDVDPVSIEIAKKRIGEKEEFKTTRGNFSKLLEIAKSNGFEEVSGIIFDLGFSSRQIEDEERGFGFKSITLDMRMDPSLGVKAIDIINNFDERKINEIFTRFGQERNSRRITNIILRARERKRIESGKELAEIIEEGAGRRGKIHPATRVFQALRIVVNSELESLKEALPQATELLKTNGRLVVISFHSLEDQIVKDFLKNEARIRILTKKPIGPDQKELKENPRARSAKLRAGEKV